MCHVAHELLYNGKNILDKKRFNSDNILDKKTFNRDNILDKLLCQKNNLLEKDYYELVYFYYCWACNNHPITGNYNCEDGKNYS